VDARRRTRGFTLVEMMVVIAILGLLMALLVPVVSKAMQTVIQIRTEWMLRDIGIGLDMFRDELGAYPPSDPNKSPTGVNSGAANLVYFLRGPSGTGWGYACGQMPFGNSPDGTYGPYYQAEEALVAYDLIHKENVAGFLDPIEPSGEIDGRNWGRILYYRAEGGKFIYEHNEVTVGSSSERIQEGYANLEHSGLVSETDAGSVGAVREGYLLVSPGLDRRYGRVVPNPKTGEYEPPPPGDEGGICDDGPTTLCKFLRRTQD